MFKSSLRDTFLGVSTCLHDVRPILPCSSLSLCSGHSKCCTDCPCERKVVLGRERKCTRLEYAQCNIVSPRK